MGIFEWLGSLKVNISNAVYGVGEAFGCICEFVHVCLSVL